VIPSRNRPEKAANTLKMMPMATVYVDEREIENYLRFVPKEKLVAHAPTNNLAEVRNIVIYDYKEPVLVQVDDDLKGIRFMGCGDLSRLITDAAVIQDVIENTIQVCEDLDIGAFGWNRSGNPMLFFPGDPIGLTSPATASFGIRGSARYRKFDVRFYPRADFDWNMRCLLKDRITYCDRRIYFDHGPIFGGKGGTVDTIAANQFELSTDRLKRRWGQYITCDSFSKTGGGMGKRGTHTRAAANKFGMSIHVRRKNPIARMEED
jgi:hypothetical protein